MSFNKPPTIAGQLDRCDVCGTKIHRNELVRTQVEFVLPEGSNYIVQSSYDGSHWTTDDSADLGGISVGVYADHQRLSLADDNTFTELNGAQTFSSGKKIYTTVACTNPTSWSSLCFSAEVGPYHRSTSPSMTVSLGVFDIGSPSTLYEIKEWTGNTQRRMWWTATPSEITAAGATLGTLGFYIKVTGTAWWADRLQLEKNATSPGNFIKTSGTAIDRTEETSMAVRKVCPSCLEPLFKKSEKYGRPSEAPVAVPVTNWIQEI
jgi:hypothetical protein